MIPTSTWGGGFALFLMLAGSAAPAGAPAPQAVGATAGTASGKPDDNYDSQFQRYLQAARATTLPAPDRSDIGWIIALGSDGRARNVNDLVTVRVVESIVATGSADTSLSKKSDGSGSVTSLFGLETKLPGWLDPSSLLSSASSSDFAGGGTTMRSGELNAVVTARVVEVLPNGDMVLEGAREIDINGDRQIVVLTGVVRPRDLTPENVVLSPQIGQLRIRYFGRGLIKDNLKPGWLIRILNKIF